MGGFTTDGYDIQDPDVGKSPEQLLAEAFKRDLGVTMDPMALRIFIRWRWDRVQKLAHKIHAA